MFRASHILTLAFLVIGAGAFAEPSTGTGSDHDPLLRDPSTTSSRGPSTYISYQHPRAKDRTLDITAEEYDEFTDVQSRIKDLPLSIFLMAKTAKADETFMKDAFDLIRKMRSKTVTAESSEARALAELLIKAKVLPHYLEKRPPGELKPNGNRLAEDLTLLGVPFGAKNEEKKNEESAHTALEILFGEPFKKLVAEATEADKPAPPKLGDGLGAPPKLKTDGAPPKDGEKPLADNGAPSKKPGAGPGNDIPPVTNVGDKPFTPPINNNFNNNDKNKNNKNNDNKNLADQNNDTNTPPQPGNKDDKKGSGSPPGGSPPPSGNVDAKYKPNDKGVTAVETKAKANIGQVAFDAAPKQPDIPEELKTAAQKATEAGEAFAARRQKQNEEFEAAINQYGVDRVKNRVALAQKALPTGDPFTNNVGVVTPAGNPVVDDIQQAETKSAAAQRKLKTIQGQLVNQPSTQTALSRTSNGTTSRNQFLAAPIRPTTLRALRKRPNNLN